MRWPAWRTTFASWASPWWRGSRRILTGITCSGTTTSATCPVTAQPAARTTCGICGRTQTGRPRSPRGCRKRSPGRYRWTRSASSPVCPPGRRRSHGMARQVRIIEHPAHSPGHAALLIEERGVLAAGDMLSDVFVPMLDNFTSTNDPVEEYLVGLQMLEDVADDVDFVIPGHGSVGEGDQVRARIEQDRAYMHALRDGHAPSDPRIDVARAWLGMGQRHPRRAGPERRPTRRALTQDRTEAWATRRAGCSRRGSRRAASWCSPPAGRRRPA